MEGKQFFSARVVDGEEYPLDPVEGRNIFITKAAIADLDAPYKRAVLQAEVETLQADLMEKDPNAPGVMAKATLANFTPSSSQVVRINAAFSKVNITSLFAYGADIIVSGYTEPTQIEFSKVHQE